MIAARAAQQLSRFSAEQARAAVPVLPGCLGTGEPMLVDAAVHTLRLWRVITSHMNYRCPHGHLLHY